MAVYIRIVLVQILLCSWTILFAQGGFKSRFLPTGLTSCESKFIVPYSNGFLALSNCTENIDGYSINKLCIMKLDEHGSMVWIKKYGGKNYRFLSPSGSRRSVIYKNNYLYYAGPIQDSTLQVRGALIKFDVNGDSLWQRLYDDPNKVIVPQAITFSIDNALYISGYLEIGSNNTRPCLLMKFDTLGNELWRKQIDKVFPNVIDGRSLIQESITKKIVIVGYQYIGNSSTWSVYDSFLVTDSIGNLISHKSYLAVGGLLSDVIETSDAKILAVGTKYFPNTYGGSHYKGGFAVKIDLNNINAPLWMINGYGQLSTGSSFDMANQPSNSTILLSGAIDTLHVLNQLPNMLVRHTLLNSQNDSIIWNRLYNYKANSVNVFNTMSPNYTCLLANKSWASAISVSNVGMNPNFFVKYDSTGCDSTQEYCLNPLGFEDAQNYYSYIRIFPNPTEIDLKLSFHPQSGISKIRLINTLGQILREEDVSDHTTEYSIPTFDLERGIYFIQCKTAAGSITKQFVKN